MDYFTVAVSILTIIRVHKLVLLLRGMISSMGNIGHVVVFTLMNRNTNWSTPCWKDTVASNISYLTKGWSKRSFLSIVRESIFVEIINK